MKIVMGVLGVAFLKTELMACVVFPQSIFAVIRADSYIQRVVIGTPTQVDTLSAQFRVEAFLKGQTFTEILSLITAPEKDAGSCYSPLTSHYEVDQRYLLMLPEEGPDGNYYAPKYSPWRINLDSEPSEEEGVFLEYVNDAIEHNRAPISIAIEGGSEFIAGESIPIQLMVSNHMAIPLMVSNHMALPLSIFEPVEGAQPPTELRFGLYIYRDTGGSIEEVPLQAEVVIGVPANESMMIELNLVQLYGIKESGMYFVGGFFDVPVAPGRSYREEAGPSATYEIKRFTVTSEDPNSAVSEGSWGSVKSVCCR